MNLYDTAVSDEEEAIWQTINHESSIHHARFLNDRDLLAVSHDERMSIYHLSDSNNSEDITTTIYGDVRQSLACDYIVDVINDGTSRAVVATGKYKSVPNLRLCTPREADSM